MREAAPKLGSLYLLLICDSCVFYDESIHFHCVNNGAIKNVIIIIIDLYSAYYKQEHSEYSESGLGVAPWTPAPPGDHHWQTLTCFRNPNVEPSSYPYISTEWFSDMPTNFGLPPVCCSQCYKKNRHLDWLKRSRWYILLYIGAKVNKIKNTNYYKT